MCTNPLILGNRCMYTFAIPSTWSGGCTNDRRRIAGRAGRPDARQKQSERAACTHTAEGLYRQCALRVKAGYQLLRVPLG